VPVGIQLPALMTLFQIQTPDRLRGRVFAALGMGGSLAGVLGAGIAGALGQTVSVMDLLTVQGAGCVVAGLLFRVLAGRGPDTLAEPVEPTPPAPTAGQAVVPAGGAGITTP
jgi:MFS family permease